LKKFALSREAVTRMQAIAIAVIIIVVAIAGVAIYYLTLPPPAPPIRIGVITPLSAPADYLSGKLIKDLAELFVEEQKAKGGVLGRQLELVIADQTLDSGVAIGHLARMVTENKIVGLIGPWESLVALPVAEATETYQTIMFVTYSWADDITAKHHKYVFRVGVFNRLIAGQAMDFIKWAKYKNVAVLVEESPYGFGQWEGLTAWAAEKYPELKLTQIVCPMGLADYTPMLLKVKAMEPPADLVICHMNLPHAAVIQKQAYEVGLFPSIDLLTGSDYPFWDPKSWWDAVKEAGVGVLVPTYYSRYTKLTTVGEEFVSTYKAKFGFSPACWIMWYWDTLRILVKAIEDTGSTDPDVLAKHIEGIDIEGTTGRITFKNDPTPGSVLWHQWIGMTQFIFKLNALGDTPETALQVYPPVE